MYSLKKWHRFCLCLLSILPFTGWAATPIDDDGVYIAIFGGFAHLPGNVNDRHFGNVKYKNGFDAGGALGYQGGPIRYEGEVSYIRAQTKSFRFRGLPAENVSGNSHATTFMANVFYDFFHQESINPFIGVGVGFARIEATLDSINTPRFNENRYKIAYQGMAGLRLTVTDNIAVGANYRYFTTTRADKFGRRFQAHIANISLAYKFNRVINPDTTYLS